MANKPKKYNPTIWSRADAMKVNENDLTTMQPQVPYDFKMMSDEKVFIWDTMPIRDYKNEILSIDGWSVIFTLTADREPQNYINAEDGSYDIQNDWVNRHGRAYFTYWYSKTGKDWIHGGRVMAPGVSPTTAEWAGTPIVLNDKGDMSLYYTCVKFGYAQIAKVNGKIKTSADGVTLEGFNDVKLHWQPDGVMYQDFAQNVYGNFRDPSPFIDPVSGKLYCFFEGNVAGDKGTHIVGNREIGQVPPGTPPVPGDANLRVGCIGIAVAKDGLKGDEWEVLPPLITAVGVNDQLERPHFVYKDGKYYLFTISHKFTYASGLNGPDGVYGFVSDHLFGPYEPLNGSGLVLGNSPEQPMQTYSHLVMKNGMVTSFIDTVPSHNGPDYRIGGVEAPTVKISIKGNRTFITEVHEQGYIPPTKNIQLKKEPVAVCN